MLEFGDIYWDKWLERTEKVRKQLAGFIGADREEIGFTTNTSHGMNLVAQFLKNISERQRQRKRKSSYCFDHA
jgi:cysteine desulfurase / selenocysteine lyase